MKWVVPVAALSVCSLKRNLHFKLLKSLVAHQVHGLNGEEGRRKVIEVYMKRNSRFQHSQQRTVQTSDKTSG